MKKLFFVTMFLAGLFFLSNQGYSQLIGRGGIGDTLIPGILIPTESYEEGYKDGKKEAYRVVDQFRQTHCHLGAKLVYDPEHFGFITKFDEETFRYAIRSIPEVAEMERLHRENAETGVPYYKGFWDAFLFHLIVEDRVNVPKPPATCGRA